MYVPGLGRSVRRKPKVYGLEASEHLGHENVWHIAIISQLRFFFIQHDPGVELHSVYLKADTPKEVPPLPQLWDHA